MRNSNTRRRLTRLFCASGMVVFAAALAACGHSSPESIHQPGGLAFDADGGRLYVVTPSTVTEIDPTTGKAQQVLTFKSGSYVLALHGSTAYLTAIINSGSIFSTIVRPIDLRTRQALRTITVSSDLSGLVVAPDGAKAYGIDDGRVDGGSGIVPIDVTTGIVGRTIAIADPSNVAITPDGRLAYVTSTSEGTVTPIDLTTGRTNQPIRVAHANTIGIDPDGTTALVGSNNLEAGGGSGTDYITPIDLATGQTRASIPVDVSPVAFGFAPNGAEVYVVNYGGGLPGNGSITPIDLATDRGGPTICMPGAPFDMAVSPRGDAAYISLAAANQVRRVDLPLRGQVCALRAP